MHIQAVVARKQEVARTDRVERGWFDVVEPFPDAHGLLHQHVAGNNIGAGHAIEAKWIAARNGHTWLEHHEGANRSQQAIGIWTLVQIYSLLLQTLAAEYWYLWVHVGEEEVQALPDEFTGEETRCRSQGRIGWWAGHAVQAILDLSGKRL